MMRKLFVSLLAVLLLAGCQKQAPELSLGEEQERVATMTRSAELGMVEYTIVKTIKANDVPEWYEFGNRKILFSCRANLKAGLDLSDFSAQDVKIDQQTKAVELTLPAPKLLNLSIRPEDIRLEYEDVAFFRKKFTAEDRNKLLVQGEKDIRADVRNLGILDDARKSAERYFTQMLRQMGYETVTINFK